MCERRPPNEDELRSLKDQAKELKQKAEDAKNNKKRALKLILMTKVFYRHQKN
jgi:hypothetical protein